MLAIASLLLALPVPQGDAPTAAELVADGWRLVPAYTGDHRASLDAAARARTSAADHLFRAALELEPDHVRAYWSAGHTGVLLANDARSRNDAAGELRRVGDARAALERAVELEPTDPWSAYALGALDADFGAPAAGLPHLDRAVALLDARAGTEAAGDSDAWLRFKALSWRPEALMRAGRFDEARDAMRAFHGEFSTNAFPLHMALAESHLRQRDLAAARDVYLATVEEFPGDFQAYATLGYVAGLVGDLERADARLGEALQIEPRPGLYLRLWRWILAPDAVRDARYADLVEFVENAPSSLSDWDRRLGRFCIGEGTGPEFLAEARAERDRRLDAGEAVDELLTEAWFYMGVRYEAEARREGVDLAHAQHARVAYRKALDARPVAWKWEWAFARLAHARLSSAAGRAAVPSETPDGAHFLGLHVPGEERARALYDGPLLPGMVQLLLVPDGRGGLRFRAEPVMGR